MSATAEILRAYGFDTEGENGELIRARLGRNLEKFAPVDGGWNFYVWRDGAWARRKHHVDATVDADGERALNPNYVWPDAEVAHVYGEAVAAKNAG